MRALFGVVILREESTIRSVVVASVRHCGSALARTHKTEILGARLVPTFNVFAIFIFHKGCETVRTRHDSSLREQKVDLIELLNQ